MKEREVKAEQLMEKAQRIQATLSQDGYDSIFDIVRTPRHIFVENTQRSFGRDAGQIYDIFIGHAVQVSHLFRKKRLTRAEWGALIKFARLSQ